MLSEIPSRRRTALPRWRSSPDECLYRFDVINFQHPSGDGRYLGVISRTKLNNGAIELATTPKTSQQAQDIAQNGDPTGMKTEALFNNVVKEHGGTVLDGGKYGSNNGYDHVVIFKDAEGNTYLTMVVDSKQLNSKGIVLNHNAAGGTMQMSDDWDEVVLNKLDENSEAYKVIRVAQKNGNLVKGAAYVDKTTGKLNLVRINPTTR